MISAFEKGVSSTSLQGRTECFESILCATTRRKWIFFLNLEMYLESRKEVKGEYSDDTICIVAPPKKTSCLESRGQWFTNSGPREK